MTNHASGHYAEEVAGQYLQKQGYKVLELNWRTRYCEIDIVAQKDNCVFFVEVKHRLTNSQGTGLDYITPQKLKQMSFAAEFWVQANDWGGEYSLAAVALAGDNYTVTDFVLI